MARPLRIETTGATSNFKSGAYQYDSAGNIVKIGTDWYLYDARSRLVSSRVDDQADLPGVDRLQSYTFDRYGNLGSTTTQVGAGAPVTRTSPAVTTTNRLSGGAYDAFGNVTAWSGQSYGWDMLRMMKSSPGRFLIYGPGDERIWEFAYTDPFNAATFVETYNLRGLGGQVLREYKLTGGNGTGIWSLAEEFVYRDGQLLASVTPTTTTHFTLDHLGSPRLATGPTGTTLAYHADYPFGEEATSPNQDAQRMKFTGHQRDNLGGGTTDDLDYMHARYGSPTTGRFLSVDPVLGEPSDPQSWNRYAYVTNNPVNSIDPDGRAEIDGCDGRLCEGSIEVTASLTLGDRVDRLAFNFSRPALTVMVGILNDSPTQVASGAAQTAGAAVGPVVIGKFVTPVLARIWAAFGVRGTTSQVATVIDPNKLNHVFRAGHNLDDLVRVSGGSTEAAFTAVQQAANRALKAGLLPIGPNGVLPGAGAGAILSVNGVDVQLVGGRVIDGIVHLGSFIGI